MKKKIYITIVVVILLILLVPVRLSYKDGGTVEYSAVSYSVYNYHSMWSEKGNEGFIVGIVVEIIGIEVYDNTRFESE